MSAIDLMPKKSLTRHSEILEALRELFDATTLPYLRMHLWYFLRAVVEQDYFRFRGQPVIVYEVAEHLEQVIDIFDQLHLEDEAREDLPFDQSTQANDDRLYMLGLLEIEEQFGGQIRRLRKDEIEDLNLVVRKFFSYKTAPGWKEELKNWQYYALSTASICIASDDTSMLEMYELLEKLIEAAYLLHQRKSLRYRYDWKKNGPEFARLEGPLLLTEEEFQDPLLFLCDYFGGTTLAEHAQELARWIEATFSNKPWDIGPPADLLFFHEEICRVLEATFALEGKTEPDFNQMHNQYPRVLSKGASAEICPRFLADNEFRDPYLVLEQLYRKPLKTYTEELKNWLYHALSRSPIDDINCDLRTYHFLQKLSEALYILCLRVSNAV